MCGCLRARRGGIATIALAVGVAGCGGEGNRDVAAIVASARAPMVAWVHRDVRAYCAAYTPRAVREIVTKHTGRSCEEVMRVFVAGSLFVQFNRRALASLRVSDVVITGSRARARIRYAPRRATVVETFRKDAHGRWQITSVGRFPGPTTIIR